jgi:hypothetical protein
MDMDQFDKIGNQRAMELTTAILAFVRQLNDFSYGLSSLDRIWNILFPDKKGNWHHLHINRYKHTFFITHIEGNGGSLEVEHKKGVRAMDPMGARPFSVENHVQLATEWKTLIESAMKWLKVAQSDWIKANKRIQVDYPLRYRYGIAPNALIRASLPDIYRLDKELGRQRTRKLVRLV